MYYSAATLGKKLILAFSLKVKCELPSYLATPLLGTHPREMKLCPHKDSKSIHETGADKTSSGPEACVDGGMKGGPSEHGTVFNSNRGGALTQLLPCCPPAVSGAEPLGRAATSPMTLTKHLLIAFSASTEQGPGQQ